MAVTTRAVTRAIGNINRQCHFVGYLLKNNPCINVFQHVLISFSSFLRMCIETTCGFFLTWLREVRDTLQIADDTSHVIDIL